MEIPYGKYIDSNINHELPLSTEIIPYKAIKVSNEITIDDAIHVIDTIQHAIIHTDENRNIRNVKQIDFMHCNCNLNHIKWFVISSFTISIIFVFIGRFFK